MRTATRRLLAQRWPLSYRLIKFLLIHLNRCYHTFVLIPSTLVLKSSLRVPQAEQIMFSPPLGPRLKVRIRDDTLTIASHNDVLIFPRTGAVYDKFGRLIHAASLSPDENAFKTRLLPDPQVDMSRFVHTDVIGKAVYGGMMFAHHYGHFIIDTCSRLWPLISEAAFVDEQIPIVFAAYDRNVTFTSLHRTIKEVLATVGLNEATATITDTPIRVAELKVPEASFVYDREITAAYKSLTSHIGERILSPVKGANSRFNGRCVYLSRSHLKGIARTVVNESAIEERLGRLGYVIVHPQDLTFEEQIMLFRDANHIVGNIGSAFHTMVFADVDNKRVTYLCDRGMYIGGNYLLIDRMFGVRSRFVAGLVAHPLSLKRNHSSDLFCDVDATVAALIELGAECS